MNVKGRLKAGWLAGIGAVLWSTGAWAQEMAPASAGRIDSGDTAWVLAATALVTAMIVPGLALFYGGMVRSKNVLGTMMHSFLILCVVSLVWVLWGYSLAFAPDKGGVIGGLDWTFLSGVGAAPHPLYAPTVPHVAFMIFQLLFAAFTPALIVGAFAERIRFGALVVFTVAWSLFVYAPLAHWMWGGGWLSKLGAVDFAGGTVVHLSAGASALACALVLGSRRGWRTDYMAPHNLPFVLAEAGDAGAGALIAKLLTHADADVVASAIEALVEMGDGAYRADIERLSKDPRALAAVETEEGESAQESGTVGELATEAAKILESLK